MRSYPPTKTITAMASTLLKGYFFIDLIIKNAIFHSFIKTVAILLAVITLTIALPSPRVDCGECVDGVPDVPRDPEPITPVPIDYCADGVPDVPAPVNPDITTEPPPC